MQLTGDLDLNLTYGDLTFGLSDVDGIHIEGDLRYPEDEDVITIKVMGETINVRWAEVTDRLARDILLSYLAPV